MTLALQDLQASANSPNSQPLQFFENMFCSKQTRNGGIIRRSIQDIFRYASAEKLEAEVRRRGFHLALIGDQYLILCNPESKVKVIC